MYFIGKNGFTSFLCSATLILFLRVEAAENLNCSLPGTVVEEIRSHAGIVKHIAKFVLNGPQKGETYKQLAKFVDTFGSRISGSQNLENAIDYMVHLLKDEGLENVHTEATTVPHWVRGNESAYLVYPRYQKISLLGLGSSVGTPKGGITAEVVVVKNFEELKAKGSQVEGKIVVYNQDFVSYGASVQYRQYGATQAAKVGGVASLIRSITPYSIYSPHTGWQDYSENITKIPTACITIEDAEMLHRMYLRGEKLVITLKMDAQNLPPTTSRNTIAEIQGHQYPDQVVIVSGHLDSWDVGDGAMDDGAGAFISWRALSILHNLQLRPTRTLRSILWTGEEEGLYGAQTYFNDHKDELNKTSLIMESDIGTFDPLGLTFSGKNKDAQCIMKEILLLLDIVNATKLELYPEGSDITIWMNAGVPGSSLINANSKYFYYHHSNGDRMTVEDTHYLDMCTVVWTAASYVIANLKDLLPR